MDSCVICGCEVEDGHIACWSCEAKARSEEEVHKIRGYQQTEYEEDYETEEDET